MKSRSIFSLAAAGMLSLFSVQAANAVQVEEHSTWVAMSNPTVQAEVDKSGKTTVVFVIDQNNCNACGSMLQQLIYAEADYPNISIRTGTPEEWGIPAELLPFALVLAPKCGVTKRLPNYAPQSAEAIAYLMAHINDGGAMQPVTRTCK